MNQLEIGTVIWSMHGIRRDKKIKWHAKPECVEKIEDYMYRFGSGGGISFNCIGETHFLTREDCLDDFLKKHDSFEEDIGIDEPLGEDLSDKVTEYPRTDFEDLRIYPNFTLWRITKVFANDKLFDISDFEWQNISEGDWEYETGECDKFMTLSNLSNQFYSRGGQGILTVVVESTLHGEIYQFGNSNMKKWYKHGATNGFA